MSRLEKAREEKKRRKKKSWFFVIILLLLVAIGLTTYFMGKDTFFSSPEVTTQVLIDMERSSALIDIFGITYIHVYLLNDVAVNEVRVNGEPMEEVADENKWEKTMQDLQVGNELSVVVLLDGKVAQEEKLVVEDL